MPGASTRVALALRPRDFAYYDVGAQGAQGEGAQGTPKGAWRVAPGAYELP